MGFFVLSVRFKENFNPTSDISQPHLNPVRRFIPWAKNFRSPVYSPLNFQSPDPFSTFLWQTERICESTGRVSSLPTRSSLHLNNIRHFCPLRFDMTITIIFLHSSTCFAYCHGYCNSDFCLSVSFNFIPPIPLQTKSDVFHRELTRLMIWLLLFCPNIFQKIQDAVTF